LHKSGTYDVTATS